MGARECAEQLSPGRRRLVSDTSNGWAAGGLILRSTDGGLTWTQQAGPAGFGFHSVVALTKAGACATGGTSTRAAILCTRNGGQTWTHVYP